MTTEFSLAGRRAVVTGAARGIGRALAVGLARAGADIVAVDHPSVATAEVAADVRSLGRRCEERPLDLSDTAGLERWTAALWRETGGADVLVNNAGVARIDHATDVTPETWRAIMSVNTDAVFFLSQAFARRWIPEGVEGRIVAITSKNALVAEAGLSHYNASKAAAAMIMQSFAAEWGRHGITANSVAPGMIETPIGDDLDVDLDALTAAWRERIPARQGYGTPEDLVGAVVLLASPAGRYLNGAQIVVDGGALADQLPRWRFMPPLDLGSD